MKIYTTGVNLSQSVVFSVLFTSDFSDIKMVEVDGKMTPKISPDGKTLYSGRGLKALAVVDGELVREERNVTVNFTKPCKALAGKYYALSGNVIVTVYQNNAHQVAYSLIADGLEEIEFVSDEDTE